MVARAASPRARPRVLLPADYRAAAHGVGAVLVGGRTRPHRRPALPWGWSKRAIARKLGRDPSTISRDTAPQRRSRHRRLSAVQRAPACPRPPSATTTGQVGRRCRAADNGATATGPAVESRADQLRAAPPLPGPAAEASGARDHLSGDLRARTRRVAP